ncbi:MAK10-like protein [Tanacetum coccineum]
MGYQNPERLKKAIAAQPKMYDSERLHTSKLIIDLPDSEETLEDTEESRLKMKDNMIQLYYGKLNALYDTFVFSTWMAFEGNTQRGDGVASIKRRRRDLQSDGVKDFVTASERSRLKEDLESSTWRRPSNWIERLPAGSISTWEDLTTRFLAQFFPSGRTAKLRNDILMFQQYQGESLSDAWTRFKDLLQKVPHHGIDLWLQVQIFYDHVNPVTRRTINQSAGGKLRDKNAKESWGLLQDLALYDNESWNNQRDFAKLVKAISFPQDVSMNKITSSCEIYSGPHDTQYCMENLEQAFVDYASSCTNEAGGLVSNFMASQGARLSKFEADFKQQQSEMTNKIDIVLKANIDRITGALPSDTVKNPILNVNSTSLVLSTCSCPTEDPQCSTQIHSSINTITICPERPGKLQNNKPEEEEQEEKDNSENINTDPSLPPDLSISFINEKVRKLNSFFESFGLVPQSSNTEFVCTKGDDGDVMFIEIIKQNDDSHKEEPEVGENARVGELEMEYFDIFPTMNELAYHKYLMCGPIPSIFLRNPITIEGCPSNLKILCNIGHVHVEKAYIDLNSPLNIMTRMLYNWIMKRKLHPRENTNGGVNNFTGRIKGMHVFLGNFTYVIDFMIVEDISSIIDPRSSQVILGRPFIKISNMTHDPPEGVVRFTNRTDEIAYKMPHKIEQYNSLSDLEREHTKSVYFRSEEDKIRGVEYVMSKILGFYKECLELGPEYVTGIADEGEVT